MNDVSRNDANGSMEFQRIVVVLDPSPECQALLTFAADLAEQLDVPLTGVFVADTVITDYAELPFAREITMSGALIADLSRGRMRTYYRREAERARRLLESVGRAHRVRWTFEQREGELEDELTTIVQEYDLVAVFSGLGAVVRSRDHDVVTRFTDCAAGGFLSFARRLSALRENRIMAFYTGSTASDQAVRVAALIAGRRRAPLSVMVMSPGETESHIRTLAARAEAVTIVPSAENQPATLHALASGFDLAVLPADLPADWQVAVRNLHLPRLVIRQASRK